MWCSIKLIPYHSDILVAILLVSMVCSHPDIAIKKSSSRVAEKWSSMKDFVFFFFKLVFQPLPGSKSTMVSLLLNSTYGYLSWWGVIVVRMRKKTSTLKMEWLLSWKHRYGSYSLTDVSMRARRCSRSCCNDKLVGKYTRSIRQYWLVVAQSHGEVVFDDYHRYGEEAYRWTTSQ